MKKITLTILYMAIICIGITKSFAQNAERGGQQFTVDGFSYEATNFNPNEAELIGGTAEGSLVIPSTVTFQDVTYNITEIGFSAFSGNISLTSVTIPATVVDINDNAFANTGLTDVIALGTTAAEIRGNSFGVRSGINLTVPFGAEETYLNNGWEGFATINGTAGTFEVNNITYGINSITGNTVTVLDTSLTGNVTIPTTVTSNSTVYTITKIGVSAFENKQLTSITMPNTVTDIGNAAFRDNQLASATLSNTLETIGENAFRNNQLTSVTLVNTLTTLGDRAFQNNQIASIDIPGSVMILENSVFRENDLATINLAEGITTIEASAFKDNNLTNITIPASVTSIEFFGFNDNPLTNLTSLATIPPVIGNPNFIFGTNNSLGNIDLIVPDGTEAAYQAANWVGFNSVNGAVPNEVGNTFEFNGLLYTITALVPNEVNVVGGNTIPATLVIPAVASNGGTDFSVTGIGNNAFFNTGITSVSIPNSVITIGSLAFEDNLLTNLVIPDGVQTIENRAFRVNQIQAVSIPNSVTSLGGQAFQGNQLSSLVLSQNITEIEQGTFDVNNLTSATLPDGIVTIGSRAFRENGITDLILPSSVVTIVDEAFVENPLATITANGTTPATIETNSFGSRVAIDLTVPTGTETTYETAGWTGFASVNGVIQLNIGNTFTENNFNYTIIGLSPNSVEITGGTSIPQDLIINATVTTEGTDFSVVRVGAGAFENAGLTSVQLPNTLKIINSTAFQSNQITSLSIPDGVTSIGLRAFRLNQIGGSVVIPNSVTSLGNGAFELNNISAITISENISAIGAQTFRENQLTTVTIPANINSLGSNCFRSNPLLTEVIVLNTTPLTFTGSDPFFK